MSDFDAFADAPQPSHNDAFSSSSDPTADFLAHEQAILGADAMQFNTGDALPMSVSTPANDDFAAMQTPAPQQPQQYPLLASNPTSIPLPASPAPSSSTPVGASAFRPPEIESEAVKQWREQQREQIAERDARAERKRQETLEKAKRDIDKFYEDYNAKREKALNDNKAAQEALMNDLNDTITGTVWERVMKHIELVSESSSGGSSSSSGNATGGSGLNPTRSGANLPSNTAITQKKSGNVKDVTRFKQLLVSLKADKTAVFHQVVDELHGCFTGHESSGAHIDLSQALHGFIDHSSACHDASSSFSAHVDAHFDASVSLHAHVFVGHC
ncbi:hypothetical protein RI367_004794 [Sorochytrium milnesiophthora]